MTRLVSILEGAALILLGGFMLHLVRGDSYWYFLNPKFEPLTAVAGAVLVLIGLALPFSLSREIRPTRLFVLLAFVCMAVWVQSATNREYTAEPYGMEEPQAVESRVELGGEEYVRMNTAELFMLLAADSGTAPKRVALRGMVRRSPEMDRQGRFVLVRMAIVCCLADAVAPGFVVVGSKSLPEDGAWVSVAGRFEPLAVDKAGVGSIAVQGVISTLINDKFVIYSRKTEQVKRPELPFIFEFRREEPYAY